MTVAWVNAVVCAAASAPNSAAANMTTQNARIGPLPRLIFVAMIAGGALILSLAAVSFVRYFRDVQSIRERGDGPWLPAEDDRPKHG